MINGQQAQALESSPGSITSLTVFSESPYPHYYGCSPGQLTSLDRCISRRRLIVLQTPNRHVSGRSQNHDPNEATGEKAGAVRTPRFVLGSAGPSGSAKQFAATPRFAFSQKRQIKFQDDIVESDESVSPIEQVKLPVGVGQENLPNPQTKVIADSEESDSDLLLLKHEDTGRTSHVGCARPGAADNNGRGDEIEGTMSASPSERRPKRRRVSIISISQEDMRPIAVEGRDRISLSPSLPPLFPAPSSPELLDDGLVSPTAHLMPATPFQPPSAAGTNQHLGSQKPSRFRFATTIQQSTRPPDLGNDSVADSGTTAFEHSTQKPKPRFIIPQTPSKAEELNISALLTSPISFPSKRRGRSKPQAHTFVPKGIASEVQSWILELAGAKQLAQSQANVPSSGLTLDQTGKGKGRPKYQYVAQVGEFNHLLQGRASATKSKPGHPNPFTLLSPSEIHPTDKSGKMLLLIGPPTYSALRPGETAKKGDWIGLQPGLIWEIELGTLASNKDGSRNVPAGDVLAEYKGCSISGAAQKWIVGLEWDLMPTESE